MAALSNPMSRMALVAGMVFIMAISVSGCGRKGKLEPPPSPNVVSSDDEGNVKETTPEKRDKPFFLDPLL